MSEREELVTLAKIAEQSERFQEMIDYMKKLVEKFSKTGPLQEDERNLLSVAYKNVIGSRRTAWRVYSSRYLNETNEKNKALCKALKCGVEKEISEQCDEIIQLLDTYLVKNAGNETQARVFFMKMKGDYYRYKVEICEPSTPEEAEAREKSAQAYQEATEEASKELPPTSPIRLGLALNYSVFYYEIMKEAGMACEMAKKAFDDALAELDNVKEEVYKDSTLIMQLLRDNLTLWKSEIDEDQDGDKGQVEDNE